jgi:hypothetical protein
MWDPASGRRGAGVALRTCELALQVGESRDDLWCLEGAITPTDGDLPEDAGVNEPLDSFSRRLEGPADEPSCTVDGENGSAGDAPQEEIGRRVRSDRGQPFTPPLFQDGSPVLKRGGVGNRAGPRCRVAAVAGQRSGMSSDLSSGLSSGVDLRPSGYELPEARAVP